MVAVAEPAAVQVQLVQWEVDGVAIRILTVLPEVQLDTNVILQSTVLPDRHVPLTKTPSSGTVVQENHMLVATVYLAGCQVLI